MARSDPEERLAKVAALYRRADLGADGRAAFRSAYPAAPDEMISTAAFHVYVDGCVAALDFLVEAERFLQDPSKEISYAPTFELLYHVYNWHQFRALLPDGKPGIYQLLAELKQFVAEDDREAIVKTADELGDLLEGHRDYPDFQ